MSDVWNCQAIRFLACIVLKFIFHILSIFFLNPPRVGCILLAERNVMLASLMGWFYFVFLPFHWVAISQPFYSQNTRLKKNMQEIIMRCSILYTMTPLPLPLFFVFLFFQRCVFLSFCLFVILSLDLESFRLSVFSSYYLFDLESFCLFFFLSFHLSIFSFLCLIIRFHFCQFIMIFFILKRYVISV